MNKTDKRLKELTARIALNVPAKRAAVLRAIQCGKDLIEAKEILGHGNWLPWLQEHFALNSRVAQMYMRIAKKAPRTQATSVRQAFFEANHD